MHYFIMTVKRYRGLWGLAGSYVTGAGTDAAADAGTRGGCFYNTYTVSVAERDLDNFDLYEAINCIVSAEQCVLSGESSIEFSIVIECDDAGAWDAEQRARVFWVHDYEAGAPGRGGGLHGWGVNNPFVALRVTRGRAMGQVTTHLYYDAVDASDAEWRDIEHHHHEGLGLRIDGLLGLAGFPLYREFLARVPGLEAEVSIDRDGAAVGLFPPAGDPLMHLASLETRAANRNASCTADDARFDVLLSEMLSTVLAGLNAYERGYLNFKFLWGNGETPTYKRSWTGFDAAFNPLTWIAAHREILHHDDYYSFPVSGHWPYFLSDTAAVFDLMREWRVLTFSEPARVNFNGNADIVNGLIARIDSMETYILETRARYESYVAAYQEWTREGDADSVYHPQTFLYENWTDIENWLFELQRCFALLQVVSYIKPRGRIPQGAQFPATVDTTPRGGVRNPPFFLTFWESFRIGKGPFLTIPLPDSGDDHIGAVFLGPQAPDWNPSTEGVPGDAYALTLWELWQTGNPFYDQDPESVFLTAKRLWQIASPSQKAVLYLALAHAVENGYFEGKDPYPDVEPTLPLG